MKKICSVKTPTRKCGRIALYGDKCKKHVEFDDLILECDKQRLYIKRLHDKLAVIESLVNDLDETLND